MRPPSGAVYSQVPLAGPDREEYGSLWVLGVAKELSV